MRNKGVRSALTQQTALRCPPPVLIPHPSNPRNGGMGRRAYATSPHHLRRGHGEPARFPRPLPLPGHRGSTLERRPDRVADHNAAEPLHTLRPPTMILGTVSTIDDQRGDCGKTCPHLLPPGDETITQTITGHFEGDGRAKQFVAGGEEHTHRRDGRYGLNIMISRNRRRPTLATVSKWSSFSVALASIAIRKVSGTVSAARFTCARWAKMASVSGRFCGVGPLPLWWDSSPARCVSVQSCARSVILHPWSPSG